MKIRNVLFNIAAGSAIAALALLATSCGGSSSNNSQNGVADPRPNSVATFPYLVPSPCIRWL